MDGPLILAVVLVLLPAAILLTLAIVARVRSHRMPASPGPRFAAAAEGVVLTDALLLNRDGRAIAAALIDLAVRRRIRLLRPATGAGKKAPIAVETVDGAALTVTEVRVLEALFGRESTDSRVRRFSADSRALNRRVRDIMRAEERNGAAAGLFESTRRTWPVVALRCFAAAGLVVSAIIGIAAAADGAWAALAIAVVGLLAVLSVFWVTPRPWRVFLPAAEPLRAHLAGMHEYMDLAEKEPLRYLQSVQGALPSSDVSAQAAAAGLERFHLNERLLPYAVLFGMEKSWLKALGDHADALRAEIPVGEVRDGLVDVLEVIELVGGAVELVRAVGDLSDLAGGIGEALGDAADLFS